MMAALSQHDANALAWQQGVRHVERGRIVGPQSLAGTPQWAKAIVARAMRR